MTRREFTDAVRQHRQMLIKLAQKYVRGPEDARDAVQQGIADRLENYAAITLERAQISTWLAHAVITRAINMSNAKKRQAEVSFAEAELVLDVAEHIHSQGNRDLDQEKPPAQFIHDVQNALAPDVERETIIVQDVRTALLKLPETERVLIERFYLNGETLDELADETGKHKTTLMRRLQRTTVKLRAILAEYSPSTAKEAQLPRGA